MTIFETLLKRGVSIDDCIALGIKYPKMRDDLRIEKVQTVSIVSSGSKSRGAALGSGKYSDKKYGKKWAEIYRKYESWDEVERWAKQDENKEFKACNATIIKWGKKFL